MQMEVLLQIIIRGQTVYLISYIMKLCTQFCFALFWFPGYFYCNKLADFDSRIIFYCNNLADLVLRLEHKQIIMSK